MSMFGSLWFRSRAADRQRSGSAATAAGLLHSSSSGASFDEFSAPEGGFGRVDALLGERRADLAAATARPDDATHRGDLVMPVRGTRAG